MTSTPIFPFASWASGTNQNSVPANDNSRRNQILQGNIISQSVTAQPASPTEGDAYIIAATHTGTQWAGFTPKDLAIYSGGTWYAFAPVEGARVSLGGAVYIYTSGSWALWSGGVGGDMLSPLLASEVSVTAAATLTIGRMHVCSGTSADYVATLPAASGNAGKFIGVRMAAGLTRWVTVTGNGAELIDGSNTRKMWAKESAVLMCDGTGWTKVAGRSIPIQATMSRTTAAVMPTVSWNIIGCPNVVSDNTSGLAVPAGNTSNGQFRVLRAGVYQASGSACASGYAAGVVMAGGVMNGNGTTDNIPQGNPNAWMGVPAATNGFAYAHGSAPFNAALGSNLYLTVYNGAPGSISTQTSVEVRPTLSVTEIPNW